VAGLVLTLLGLIVIIYFGSIKPLNVPFSRWNQAMAPIHLGWMAGMLLCGVGLILILADTFLSNGRAEKQEINQRELRETILRELPECGMTEQQLNQFISARYGRTGILGLNTNQLKELRLLIRQRK
jgi:hypothetical protein